MERIHGTISIIENGIPMHFENAHLVLDPERAYLEIVSQKFNDAEWDILIGEFSGFEYSQVTFIDCRTSGYNSTKVGFKYKIWFDYAITEAHFASLDQIKFKESCIYFPALSKWIAHPSVSNKLSPDYEATRLEIPKEIVVSTTQIESFEVQVMVTFPYSWGDEKFEIEKSALVSIKFNEAASISKILEMHSKFKNLFMFLTNSSPEPSTISFRYETGNEDPDIGPIWCKFLGPLKSSNASKFTYAPTVAYRNVADQFNSLIFNWYSKSELVVISDFILEKRFNLDLSWKSYYLNLFNAVESFTDIIMKDSQFPSRDMRLKKREEIALIIDAQNPALKQWFLENTVYWKHPETKDRLLLYKDTIELLMSDTFDYTVDEMIMKMKKARDGIAHRGKYKHIFHPIELLVASKILEFTVRAEMLKAMLEDSEKLLIDYLERCRINIKRIMENNKHRI